MKKEMHVLTVVAMALIAVFAGICALMLSMQAEVGFGSALLSILTDVKQLGNAARVAYELATHPLALVSGILTVAILLPYVFIQGMKPNAEENEDARRFDRCRPLGLEHRWR